MTPLRQQKKIMQWWRVFSPILFRLLITEAIGGILLYFLMGFSGNYEEAYYKNAVWITGVVGLLAALPMLFWYKKDLAARKIGGLMGKQENLSMLEIATLVFMGAALSQMMNLILGIFSEFLDYQSYTDSMSAMTDEMSLWLQIFWMGLIAPFAEEVVFRWLVFLRLQDYYKRGWAIVISGALFGICHWNLLQALYASALGFVFAYILDMCGNVWSCVLLHIGANVWSLVYPIYGMYLIETEQTGILLFIFIALLAILIVGLQMISAKGAMREKRSV